MNTEMLFEHVRKSPQTLADWEARVPSIQKIFLLFTRRAGNLRIRKQILEQRKLSFLQRNYKKKPTYKNLYILVPEKVLNN